MVLAVVRASDGAAFHLYKQDLHNITTLDELRYNVLSNLLEIPPDYLICMNEEGAQLRDESVQHLALIAGSPPASTTLPAAPPIASAASAIARTTKRDPSPTKMALMGTTATGSERERRIYVFDREHLDADPDAVAQALVITEEQVLTEPPLDPQDPLHSHIGLSLHHLDILNSLITSISFQHASLHLALANLHRVNTGTHASLQVFLEATTPNLEAWSGLLTGWEDSMDAIQKVAVVPGLIGNRPGAHQREGSLSSTTTNGVKERYLGDYVSRDKMGAVKEGCKKVLDDLKMRTEAIQATVDGVLAETAVVQSEFDATSRDMDDLDACAHDTEHGHHRIEELVRTSEDMRDPTLLAQCFEELTQADAEHRDRIRFLVQHKNAMTRYLIITMQRISGLQSAIATMPNVLGELDHDARTKTDNFKHLARLEGLIPAYVATIVEVVRRREYANSLSAHSQTLGTTLKHLSVSEKERRTSYRSRFSGKLPWEVKGLAPPTDETVPFVDFGIRTGADELLPDLGREAVLNLRRTFVELEEGTVLSGTKHPIREARILLDELIKDLDELEAEFDQVALDPRHLAAASTSNLARAQEVNDLQTKVRALEEAKEALERDLQSERSVHEEEIVQLNQQVSQITAAQQTDETRLVEVRKELFEERDARSRELFKGEKEKRDARRARDEVDRRAVEDARNFQAREEELEMLFGAAKKSEEELKVRVAELDRRHVTLSSDHEGVRGELARTQSTIEELETAIKAAETSARELTVLVAEKERMLRDQRGEAELDRAVLEKEVQDLRSTIERHQSERDRGHARETTLEEVASGLRQQVAKWESVATSHQNDLAQVKKEIETHRQDKERSLSDASRELVKTATSARAAIKLAGKLHDENSKITAVLTASPQPKADSSSENVAASSSAPATIGQDAVSPLRLDYEAGKLEDLLTELSKYEPDSLTEAVRVKIDALSSATKKWIKEAKAYRERAHRAQTAANDKIAFRNFAKGDLALFLPTRNSTVPVWAAFNVSFPHHFLSATGVIQEQIKTREWIVARITSLTEKVADVKDPTSNPYLLAPGTKFFHLEVEPWSSKDLTGSRSRKHSSAEKGSKEKRGSMSSSRPRSSDPSPLNETPTRAGSTSADSTVLVESPSSPLLKRPSAGRRSVSEGHAVALPPNATTLARSEYAIIEEEEAAAESRTSSPSMPLRQPTPPSDEGLGTSPIAPSGLAVALSRSQPSSPTRLRSDPFNTNPFSLASSPPVHDVTEEGSIAIISPPATDFEPSATAAGAAPAFLPSTGRKTPSASGSSRNGSQKGTTSSSTAITSKLSPRYVRSSGAAGSSKPTAIIGARPISTSAATSPSSTSGALAAGHLPRSASSGSSILSASIHRRRPSAFSGTSPLDKALPTTEVMSASTRWTAMTESLADASVVSKSTPVAGQQLGWTGHDGVTGVQAGSSSAATPAAASAPPIARARRPSASASVLEALTGRRNSSSAGVPVSRPTRVEGEVRKLLSPK